MSVSRSAILRPGVIAVFGGTFDPPHWGHVRAAEAVRDRMGVEAVWLVPARVPPHRPVAPLLTGQERLELVKAAIEGRERLVASSVELEREGPSYTVDTLDQLAAAAPPTPGGQARVLFVVGTDAFREIRSWSCYQQLLERHPILVHRRAGCSLAAALAPLPSRFRARVTGDLAAALVPPRIFTLDLSLPDPESQQVRERLRSRLPVADLLPRPVASRIGERGYYL